MADPLAAVSSDFVIGGVLTVRRLGHGSMRLTGIGINPRGLSTLRASGYRRPAFACRC